MVKHSILNIERLNDTYLGRISKMAYYINRGKRQKKNIFLITLKIITLIGIIATATLVSGFFYVDRMIEERLVNIEAVKQNTIDFKNEISSSKEKIELNEKQAEVLNKEILRFEPVVIPESMLKDAARKK